MLTVRNEFEEDYFKKCSETAFYSVPAISLLVPALIVLLCGSLALTLEGINVNAIVTQAFTPAISTLIISGFLFYRAYPASVEKNAIRERWLEKFYSTYKESVTDKQIKEELPQKNILCFQARDNKLRFISDLKKKYDKSPVKEQLDKIYKDIISQKKEKKS